MSIKVKRVKLPKEFDKWIEIYKQYERAAQMSCTVSLEE